MIEASVILSGAKNLLRDVLDFSWCLFNNGKCVAEVK